MHVKNCTISLYIYCSARKKTRGVPLNERFMPGLLNSEFETKNCVNLMKIYDFRANFRYIPNTIGDRVNK